MRGLCPPHTPGFLFLTMNLKGYTLRANGRKMRTRTVKVHIHEETTLAVMKACKCSQITAEWNILRAVAMDRDVDCCGLTMDPENGWLSAENGSVRLDVPLVYLGKSK